MLRFSMNTLRAGMALVLLLGLQAVARPVSAELNPEHVKQVKSALPPQATMKPAQPRRLLVFNLCRGYAHGAIPLGAETIEMLGEATGAFTTVVSDDIAVFEPETLQQFDAVVMNNTTGALFSHPEFDTLSAEEQQAAKAREARLKESLLAFVAGGKGIVGIHAATDCFYEWPEYGAMMGGYFDGHPWGAGDTVAVEIVDPEHPLCAAFGGRGFRIKDEIYQLKEPYSRENLRVLLRLDANGTDMTKNGIHRTDGDFGISWIRTYGEGRVFYCSLGHNESVFWNPQVLRFYLDGIQYALGDLPADATPTAQLPAEYMSHARRAAMLASVDAALPAIRAYEPGADAEPLKKVMDMARGYSGDDPALRRAFSERITTLLEENSTLAARQFACRVLYLVSSEEAVPALAKLLRDGETADMARYALERMPDKEAGDALRKALRRAKGKAKVGIINSLGERGDEKAAGKMGRLARNSDPMIAGAAVAALGGIGGTKARGALMRAKTKLPEDLQPAVDEALFRCAGRFEAEGEFDEAEDLYRFLYSESECPPSHARALLALGALRGIESVPLLLAALGAAQPLESEAAVEALCRLNDPEATQFLTEALPAQSPVVQVLLLHALKTRGDTAALPAVTSMLEGHPLEVRVAALVAIAELGDATSVPLLARIAASEEERASEAAHEALVQLKSPEINNAVAARLDDASEETQVILLGVLAERLAYGQLPVLLATACDPSAAVRTAAFEALGALASSSDFGNLLALLLGEEDPATRATAQAAISAVSRRADDKTEAAERVLAAYAEGKSNVPVRCALLTLLGELGSEAGLALVRKEARASDAGIQEAAVRALAQWPTATALPDLLQAARSAPEKSLRIVALRAFLRLLELPSDRPAATTLKLYEDGLRLASTNEEKRLAISGLAHVPDERAGEVIRGFLSDPELGADAALALETFEKRAFQVSASDNPEAASLAIDGNMETRWSTNASQTAGQWFMVDLVWEKKIGKVILDASPSAGDYPRGYEVYISNYPEQWGEPVAVGEGTGPVTEITFPPKAGRYVRIVQTGSHGLWWSIHELTIEEG